MTARSMMDGMRYQCWTCGSVRSLDDESLTEGCCYETLLNMSDEINKAVLRALNRKLPELIARRNEYGDQIADAAIVSDDPRARQAAIKWRNFRRGTAGK